MLTPEKKQLAKDIYEQFSLTTKFYFAECYVNSVPVRTIAGTYHTTEKEVRRVLREVAKNLSDDAHDLLVCYLTQELKRIQQGVKDGYEQIEKIVDDPACRKTAHIGPMPRHDRHGLFPDSIPPYSSADRHARQTARSTCRFPYP